MDRRTIMMNKFKEVEDKSKNLDSELEAVKKKKNQCKVQFLKKIDQIRQSWIKWFSGLEYRTGNIQNDTDRHNNGKYWREDKSNEDKWKI